MGGIWLGCVEGHPWYYIDNDNDNDNENQLLPRLYREKHVINTIHIASYV